MIVPHKAGLSIVQQCRLLHLNRSGLYYCPVPEKVESLELMRLIDEQFLQIPFYGSRQMSCHLRRRDHEVGRKRVKRLMRKMGLEAVYQKPQTSHR